jgi:large subunit ribosomal protein L35
MPKIRTRKSIASRFKVTAQGKVLRAHARKSHLLVKKSSKRKRLYASKHPAAKGDAARALRAAPYLRS